MLAEDRVIEDIECEYISATSKHGEFHSAHEGYAVLLEEVEELWNEVKNKAEKRSYGLMRQEAVQIAAMAMRFIIDICMDEHGNYYP